MTNPTYNSGYIANGNTVKYFTIFFKIANGRFDDGLRSMLPRCIHTTMQKCTKMRLSLPLLTIPSSLSLNAYHTQPSSRVVQKFIQKGLLTIRSLDWVFEVLPNSTGKKYILRRHYIYHTIFPLLQLHFAVTGICFSQVDKLAGTHILDAP